MPTSVTRKTLPGRWISLGAIAAAMAGAAHAQDIGTPLDMSEMRQQMEDEAGRLNALQRSLEEQERRLNSDRQLLREQRQRLDALYQRMSGRGAPPGQGQGVADGAT